MRGIETTHEAVNGGLWSVPLQTVDGLEWETTCQTCGETIRLSQQDIVQHADTASQCYVYLLSKLRCRCADVRG